MTDLQSEEVGVAFLVDFEESDDPDEELESLELDDESEVDFEVLESFESEEDFVSVESDFVSEVDSLEEDPELDPLRLSVL